MGASRFTISTKEWDERSYVQGLLIHKPTGTSLAIEADPSASGETFEVHARTAAGKYLGKARVGYGHGSSVGIVATSNSTAELWWGDDRQKATGWAPYQIGQAAALRFVKAPALPKGDVSIDQANDILCIRNGNRFRGYRLTTAKNAKADRLFDFTIPGWGNRFQGHFVSGGRLFVHRDLGTKSRSLAHVFDYKGKQLTVIDTTKMGDEAEGFVEKDGVVYAVKRTGGTGPSRVIVATPLDVKVDPPKPPPVTPPKPPRLHGVDVASYQKGWAPAGDDAFVMVKASEGTGYTNPERAAQLAAARAKGLLVGHYHWLVPGKPLEQAAYFVQNADIKAGDMLWCDWEKQSDGSHPTIQDVAAFIAEVQRLVPTSRVGLYCNRSDWIGTSVKAGDGLWIAQYGVDKPNTATDWVFWQYSDNPIDQNVSKFTSRADLEKWTKVDRTPPVTKPP